MILIVTIVVAIVAIVVEALGFSHLDDRHDDAASLKLEVDGKER